MRLLLDMCMPGSITSWLADKGYDVVHMRQLDPRATDSWIVDRARDEKRIVVTMDLDFGDIMSHIDDRKPSVVLFRLRNPTPEQIKSRLERVFVTHKKPLEAGSIVIVEDTRYRTRRLPIAGE
ncbi:MAG: hypothetical protein GY854_29285 [Deltaproteobacteria bacterium]|nr:hypothetical protein [Deltaproteobacteria bacterium]